MTRAFKVFFLILLFFGAIWAWRFRTRDLRSWLELGGPPPLQADELASLRSKVDGVIDPGRSSRALAKIYFREPLSETPLDIRSLADPPPAGLEAEPVYEDLEEEPVELILWNPAPEAKVAAAVRPPAGEKDSKANEKAKAKGGKGAAEKVVVAERSGEKSAAGPKTAAERVAAPRSGGEKASGSSKAAEKARPVADRPSPKGADRKTDRPKTEPKVERTKSERGRSRPDPHAVPADGSKPAREPAPMVAAAEPPKAKAVTHVVRQKETLASLARRYYGSEDTERWREIYAANQERIPNPDDLAVGTVIDIPRVAADRAAGGQAGKSSKKPARGVRTVRS